MPSPLSSGQIAVDENGAPISMTSYFSVNWVNPFSVDNQFVCACNGVGTMGLCTGNLDRGMLMAPARQKFGVAFTLSLVTGQVGLVPQTMTIGTTGRGDAGTAVGLPFITTMTASDGTFQQGGSVWNQFAMLVTGLYVRPCEIVQTLDGTTTTTYQSKAAYGVANGMQHAMAEIIGDNLTMTATFPDFQCISVFDTAAGFGSVIGWRDAQKTPRSAESVILTQYRPLTCGYVIGAKDQNQATFTLAIDKTKVLENDPGDGFKLFSAGGTGGQVAIGASGIFYICELGLIGHAICPVVAEFCATL